MANLNQITTCHQLSELSSADLKKIAGGDGGAWYRLWKWIGMQVGMATIPNMENYDLDAELDALKYYGAPY